MTASLYAVWKSGASPEISHLNWPVVFRSTRCKRISVSEDVDSCVRKRKAIKSPAKNKRYLFMFLCFSCIRPFPVSYSSQLLKKCAYPSFFRIFN